MTNKMKLPAGHALLAAMSGEDADEQAATLWASLATLGRSLRDEHNPCFKFCGVMTFRDTAAAGDMLQRRHQDVNLAFRFIVSCLSELKKTVLPVVAGESGAGKTVASIRAGRGGTVIYPPRHQSLYV